MLFSAGSTSGSIFPIAALKTVSRFLNLTDTEGGRSLAEDASSQFPHAFLITLASKCPLTEKSIQPDSFIIMVLQ